MKFLTQCEVELEEGLLTLTKIKLSSKYDSEEKVNTSTTLPLYISSPSTLPPLSLFSIPINSSPYYDMS